MERFIYVFALSVLMQCMITPLSGQNRLSVSAGTDWMTIGTYRSTYQPGQEDFMTHSLELGFSTAAFPKGSFASSYNFPTFSVGMGYSTLADVRFRSQHGHYDDMVHLYGRMARELFRADSWSLGYDALLGLSYSDGVYDPHDNPGNWFFSTKLTFYLGAGFHFKLRPVHAFKRLELEADAGFRHNSSARFGYPNSGLNAYGCGVSARYYFDERSLAVSTSGKPGPVSKSLYSDRCGLSWRIIAGGGVHACSAEWLAYCGSENDPDLKRTDFRKWPKLALSGEAVWRYSGRLASGVSANVFYSSTTGMLKDADLVLYGEDEVCACPGYEPFSAGLGLVQECYYGPFALYVNAGAYVYRKMGIHAWHGWLWQKAGLRCYPEKIRPIFFGACCKAHNFKAEYLEFCIGIELGRKAA